MTVDYNDTAFGKIRSYTWAKLTEAGILSEYDYIADGFIEPLLPIIPVQQVPEFNNLVGDKPYIIYDYDLVSYSDDWFVCQETISFTIVSSNFSKIIQISQLLIDLYRRMDESARDLNIWQGANTNFKFFTFTLKDASSPTPFEEEGGRQMSQINITYKYSRILDASGRFK